MSPLVSAYSSHPPCSKYSSSCLVAQAGYSARVTAIDRWTHDSCPAETHKATSDLTPTDSRSTLRWRGPISGIYCCTQSPSREWYFFFRGDAKIELRLFSSSLHSVCSERGCTPPTIALLSTWLVRKVWRSSNSTRRTPNAEIPSIFTQRTHLEQGQSLTHNGYIALSRQYNTRIGRVLQPNDWASFRVPDGIHGILNNQHTYRPALGCFL